MSRPFDIHLPPEPAYQRNVLFAVDVLDAVTLERVSQGLEVEAEGLEGEPIVNVSGLFVWLKEPGRTLRRLTVEPGRLPYERVVLDAAAVTIPLATIELPPSPDYTFAAGVTGLRGSLVEERVPAPQPVRDAEVRLRWLDEDGVTWRDAPTRSHTTVKGDFAAIARLAPSQVPLLDANGALTVRLHARRGTNERRSTDLKLPQGRVADPSTLKQDPNPLVFSWDEMQP